MTAPVAPAAPVAIVGAGRMGRGLAHVFAYAGYRVRLIDLKRRPAAAARDLLDDAAREIARTVGLMVTFGRIDAATRDSVLARVSFHAAAEAKAALRDATPIFEAVPETAAAKQAAFAAISALAGRDAILTSTTSTMLADDLSPLVTGPERFLNGHWLNPAFLVPLVEVGPGQATDPAVVARFTALLETAGKVPVVCAASPGFIVPRIQALAMNEAARLAEEGVAAPEDIDRAIRVGFGIRFAVLGLLEFIDWGGGDILYYASDYLEKATGEARFAAPEVVKRNMAEGRLGLRAGQGFYDFRDTDRDAYQRDRLKRFADLADFLGLLPAVATKDRDAL